ncbi:alkanesulfonate transporter substrate-binding subunit [Escherichia coli]|uniref:Alkanesulfonate transporter substrate-binding subunit n=1 Tax=Escherichia coli TaxID=562 RepID=A0A484WT56_ECOLX|nr:alkanesulfonate transporter substrate-binding subunit [Escherichia coli]
MRKIIKLALAGLLSVSTLAVAAESSPEALRIGYQKGSIGMVLAKSHQLLEKRYPQTKISWVEFPAGPQMLGGVKRWQYRSRQYRGYSANLCPGCRG